MSRTEILEAAKTLLWTQGYEAMSPRKVMDLSGAGQGSLYHHFRSKRELAKAALKEVCDEMLAATDAILQSRSTPPLERLRNYLTLPREGTRGCRVGRLSNEASIQDDADLRAILSAYFGHVEAGLLRTLEEAEKRGDLRPGLDLRSLANAMAAVVQGGYVLSRSTNDDTAVTRATAGLLALIEAASN